MKKKHIHFRNDDVRDSLDKSLIQITNIFIKYKIPITHAVEPANVTKEVIEWLTDLKKRHPVLIEIGQHGYEHKLKNDKRPGEFGGNRSYQEQYDEIKKGKDLMDKYFGELWHPIFTFPFGGANIAAYKAINDLNFTIVNGGYGIDPKRKLFYLAGHILRRNFLLGKRIPYDLEYKPGTNLFEINMNFGFIKKYLDEEYQSVLQTIDNMKSFTNSFLNSDRKTIGVLLHHRYHNTDEKVSLVEEYLNWIKSLNNIKFSNQETIYNTFR